MLCRTALVHFLKAEFYMHFLQSTIYRYVPTFDHSLVATFQSPETAKAIKHMQRLIRAQPQRIKTPSPILLLRLLAAWKVVVVNVMNNPCSFGDNIPLGSFSIPRFPLVRLKPSLEQPRVRPSQMSTQIGGHTTSTSPSQRGLALQIIPTDTFRQTTG